MKRTFLMWPWRKNLRNAWRLASYRTVMFAGADGERETAYFHRLPQGSPLPQRNVPPHSIGRDELLKALEECKEIILPTITLGGYDRVDGNGMQFGKLPEALANYREVRKALKALPEPTIPIGFPSPQSAREENRP